MARRLRKPLLAIVPLALVVVVLIVLLTGSPSPRRGPGCDNPVASALNQYCDAVPAGTGAQAPRKGEPALALRLSPRLVSRIRHARGRSGQSRRALLTLPAPGARHRLRSGVSTSDASVGAISGSMMAVLAVLGVLLLGAAAVRWRVRAGRGDRVGH